MKHLLGMGHSGRYLNKDRMCTIVQMANLYENDNRYRLLNSYKAAMHSAKPFSWIISFNPIDHT